MSGKRPRVLVMDDEEGIRDVLSRMLSLRGVDVEAVDEGSVAIEKYRKALQEGNRFDVVILDLTVPTGLGGRETMEQLLSIDPQVRGIVASGYSNDPIMVDYCKYGFSGAVSKPFVIGDIVKQISSIVDV
jgi:two-component system, cell cycle sensor histidine kinase and response regulator CckA